MERIAAGSIETINTTLGDLIEAVTQVALEAGKTEEEGYKLASLVVNSILEKHQKKNSETLN